MNKQMTIYVPAVPVAQPRQRHRVATIKGKAMSLNYTPKKDPVNAFKASCAEAMRQAYQGPPLGGPLEVAIDLVFPRTKAQTWKTKPMPRLRHTKKPDRDNCEKAVLDALKGLLFVDDCQVCDGAVRKWIASGAEQPHVLISVRELAP